MSTEQAQQRVVRASQVPSGYLGRRREKKQRQDIKVPIEKCVARAQHCLLLLLLLLLRLVQSFLASASFASVRKAQINVVSVVLLRHQPENVKGKRKTEQTPVGTFGTAKESSRGPTCYSLKRPSATSALCYADVNVNGGGEGPPVLGKTPELHRISRCFFSFQQTPDPAPLRGGEGEESQVAGGHPKANLSGCIFPVRRPNFCLGHHQRYSVPPIWFP